MPLHFPLHQHHSLHTGLLFKCPPQPSVVVN